MTSACPRSLAMIVIPNIEARRMELFEDWTRRCHDRSTKGLFATMSNISFVLLESAITQLMELNIGNAQQDRIVIQTIKTNLSIRRQLAGSPHTRDRPTNRYMKLSECHPQTWNGPLVVYDPIRRLSVTCCDASKAWWCRSTRVNLRF